jgi:DNA-binding transcriptional ArsR family regulator
MSSADAETRDDLVFKALSNQTRRAILDMLRDQPQTTGEICAHFSALDRCTIMQHLKVLEGAGLVIAHRVGRVRWNHLNALPIRDIHARWIGPHAAGAVDRLARLKADLETRQHGG